MEETSDTANGGLSGIALCSSRSRSHRNSGSYRNSRRNSQEKESSASPKQRRSDKRDSLPDDGNIVVDTSSILDEIMAQTFDSEDEKTPPPRGVVNGTGSPSRVGERKRDESSRQRSAAIDTSSSPALKSKAKQASQRAAPEMSSLTVPSLELPQGAEPMKAAERKSEIRRSGSISKEDYRKSGGSWGKLRGQINGGRALGMFYHNRRSQYFEESFEEPGQVPERNETHPISPLTETSVGIDQKTEEEEEEVSGCLYM